ncbi:hypothetical protein N658DRAFT_54863 [Parathielavia hyrcaniae]|uniref:Uncharacterized protein n=1 Tax=Parathielavia hyrcaniae TaxID=113614 RepID=A0AAN6PQM5_9PEZI|nr:hypothetical protein N658DRAFT_54863 [Parathielavia hyrcaniae]
MCSGKAAYEDVVQLLLRYCHIDASYSSYKIMFFIANETTVLLVPIFGYFLGHFLMNGEITCLSELSSFNVTMTRIATAEQQLWPIEDRRWERAPRLAAINVSMSGM